jgi:hypothetical protein
MDEIVSDTCCRENQSIGFMFTNIFLRKPNMAEAVIPHVTVQYGACALIARQLRQTHTHTHTIFNTYYFYMGTIVPRTQCYVIRALPVYHFLRCFTTLNPVKTLCSVSWCTEREAITHIGVVWWDSFRTTAKSYKLSSTPGAQKLSKKSRRDVARRDSSRCQNVNTDKVSFIRPTTIWPLTLRE